MPKLTAAEYREKEKASDESFNNTACNPTIDLHSQLYHTLAEIQENGGKAWFTILCDNKDCNMIDAKIIVTQFGVTWILGDKDAEKLGRRFVPVGSTSTIQKKLGVHEESRLFPAWAKLKGYGGYTSVTVHVYRTDVASYGAADDESYEGGV